MSRAASTASSISESIRLFVLASLCVSSQLLHFLHPKAFAVPLPYLEVATELGCLSIPDQYANTSIFAKLTDWDICPTKNARVPCR